MKYGVELETDRLILRHTDLSEQDRDCNHFLMSDEKVRRFYATRLTRAESDAKLESLAAGGGAGTDFNWGLACLKSTGQPIGFTGLAHLDYETPFTPAVEIGWLFRPEFWGKGYATEAASELIRHGFEDLKLPEIVAFAVHNNHQSIKVMQRIGMQPVRDGGFDHPLVPETHSHLKHHVLYRISASQCQAAKKAGKL